MLTANENIINEEFESTSFIFDREADCSYKYRYEEHDNSGYWEEVNMI